MQLPGPYECGLSSSWPKTVSDEVPGRDLGDPEQPGRHPQTALAGLAVASEPLSVPPCPLCAWLHTQPASRPTSELAERMARPEGQILPNEFRHQCEMIGHHTASGDSLCLYAQQRSWSR